MSQAFVGLGANLGDPASQIRQAIGMLDGHATLEVIATSRLYRSAPLGPPGQPDYANAVVQLDSALTAQGLMTALLEVERAMGRRRDGQRWGPRHIDLDLLLYDNQVVAVTGLTVPHPHLHERNFVLVPLAEIAPDAEVPGHGRAAQLAAAIGSEGLRVWERSDG